MNLNKVFIIGRLTHDPEARTTNSGQGVTTIRMATNRVWNNNSGEKQEATEYHTVVAWGRLGEIAGQYLKKGGLVMIEGRLQTRNWTDQNSTKRYVTEIIAESLQLGPRSASTGSGEPRSAMDDVKRPSRSVNSSSVPDSEIPIIGEDEPVSAGVEEEERKINKEDLPF